LTQTHEHALDNGTRAARVKALLDEVERRQSSAQVRCLGPAEVELAVALHEEALAFCAEHGVPVRAIRVVVTGGHCPHWRSESTVVSCIGKKWTVERTFSRAPSEDAYGVSWLQLTEAAFPRERARTLGNTRKDGGMYKLFLYPEEKAAIRVPAARAAPVPPHAWVEGGDGARRCTVCALELRYLFVAPGAGGPSVRLAGEKGWWVVREVPPCPAVPETLLAHGGAR
jgi:hypothetical protein